MASDFFKIIFKKIILLILPAILLSGDSQKRMDKFVYNYFLLAQSRAESSPLTWQDLREGYLRNFTVRNTDVILDSLDQKKLSSYHAGLRHFQKIDSLGIEIKSGKDYKHIITDKKKPNYNINYFSSSKE